MKSKALFKHMKIVFFYAIICFQASIELEAFNKGSFGNSMPIGQLTNNKMPSLPGGTYQGVGADLSKMTRAPRPDALSFPGSTPQIVGSSDTALLAEIQKCVCEINNELRRSSCCSEVSVIDSKIDVITSLIDENCCSEIGIIDSKLNVIQTTLDNIEMQLETLSASSLESIVSTFTLLVELSNELVSTVEIIVSLSDIIADNFVSIAEILESVIDIVTDVDSKIDVITSILENTENCCSEIDVIDSKIDIVTSIVENITTEDCCSEVNVIDSKINVIASIVENITFSVPDTCCSEVEQILFNVGSRSDFAFSYTDQISTIDQIDQLNLTVIAWLKTLLADLHGL